MVWAELTISNARKCQICAYYRPHPDEELWTQGTFGQSLVKIDKMVSEICVIL
jgi:hypothetical protein